MVKKKLKLEERREMSQISHECPLDRIFYNLLIQ
jgi:hypothetical protein